jgi:hypothetical protein
MAPHRHLVVVVVVVVVTVSSTRTNTNAPRVGARLPLPGSLALKAQHGKLDTDLRTHALLGTPSAHSVHGHYPFALEDRGRLAPIAAELVYCMAVLVAVRRVLGMGVVDSRSLRYDIYVRMHHFVRRTTSSPFRRFGGDLRREFKQRLSAALYGTLGSYHRGALQEGSADAVACLPVPRAMVFSFFLLFAW